MKIEKTELAKKISQLKSVVPKKTTIAALQGILVAEGYLIAANNELTVKAKLEGIEDEKFIIPAKAFDLINSLPAGEVTITYSKDEVTIQMGKIKNKFKTHPAENFIYTRTSIEAIGEGEAAVSSDKMKKAISHVLYAIPATAGNQVMTGMYISCSGGKMDFVGFDGHRIAWDSIEYDGNFGLIIPKPALEKILQLDIQGDMRISYDANGALFATEEFEVYTRLIQGEYFKYQNMFAEGSIYTVVERKVLLESINRAQLCGFMEDKAPVILEVVGSLIRIEYKNAQANYEEEIATQVSAGDGLKIGFNPRLLIDSLKSFDCDNVSLSFTSNKMPLIIRAEDSDMTALVLPVNIK